MREELKPCPFCGGPAKRYDAAPCEGQEPSAGCDKCSFHLSSFDHEDCIAAWNQRTPQGNSEVGEALARAIARCESGNSAQGKKLLAAYVIGHADTILTALNSEATTTAEGLLREALPKMQAHAVDTPHDDERQATLALIGRIDAHLNASRGGEG